MKQTKGERGKEAKEAFFAHYYGQTVYINNTLENINDATFNPYLLLKPLTQITDEDAIEVARMNTSVDWRTGRENHIWKNTFGHTIVSNGSGIVQKYGQTIVTDLQYLTLQQCDFLRSKGYALPYLNYSVLQMVDMGWIKLKE